MLRGSRKSLWIRKMDGNRQMKSGLQKSAFSLIEVNLAILLLAVGLFGLMSLFPLGLQESKQNVSDTYEAMFADHILNSFQGKASTVSNWSDWVDSAGFKAMLDKDLYPLETEGWTNTAVGGGVNFPEDAADNWIRYEITISSTEDESRKQCRVRVARGQLGDFEEAVEEYLTEMTFVGM